MRILPCFNCHRPALARRSPEILLCQATINSPVHRYTCMRCNGLNRITASQFILLPRMTEAELTAATCDLAPSVKLARLDLTSRAPKTVTEDPPLPD